MADIDALNHLFKDKNEKPIWLLHVCLQGRESTVRAYADSLYQLIEQGYGTIDNAWHETLFERYENIVGCLEVYKGKTSVKILPLFI